MRLLPAFVLAALATPAFANDLSIRLADGATWTITAEHTRKSNGGAAAENWSLTTAKRLTWHSGKSGAGAQLTIDPISATPGPGSPPELAQARSLAVPATINVDENLEPGEFINSDEVRAAFVRLVPKAKGADAKLVDASAKAMVATELFMTAHGQGLALEPGVVLSADVPIANPLGGPPVRGIVTERLNAVDETRGIAKVEWRQALDPSSFKTMVATMVADLGKVQMPPDRLGQAKATLESAAYENRTDCSFEIDTRTGLARRTECTATTTVTIQGRSQQVVDTWTITQSLPDKT